MPGANCKLPTFAKRKRKVRNWDGFVQRCRALLKKTLIKYLFVCSHVGKPRPLMLLPYPGILFEIFIFGPKTRENVVVLDYLAVDNFDFTDFT